MDLNEARRILAALKSGQPLIDRHKAAQALEWALMQAYMLRLEAPYTTGTKCWCSACQPRGAFITHMILCPICGNKRCPKAAHHGNVCAGINALGQIPAPPGDDDGRPSTAPDR